MFVIYAFGPCNSWLHETFHRTPLGPEEGRDGVDVTQEVVEVGWGADFTQVMIYCNFFGPVIDSVTKLPVAYSWCRRRSRGSRR